MAKKMLIDATHPEETRVVVVDGNKVDDFDFESVAKRQLSGNIYLAKVTRVEPSLQAAFVDYGGNRHGFLAFAEIHPDYYQIPVADREALIAEEAAEQEASEASEARRNAGSDDKAKEKPRRSRRKKGSKAAKDESAGGAEASEAGAGGEPTKAEAAEDGTAEEEAPKGRRSRRGRKADKHRSSGLELIDFDENDHGSGEDAGRKDVRGLEIADLPDEEDQSGGEDSENDAGTGGKDTPPKSMAEKTGLDEGETISEDVDAAQEGEKKAEKKSGKRSAKSSAKAQPKARKGRRSTRVESEETESGEVQPVEAIESIEPDEPQEEAARARAQMRRRYRIQDVIKVRQILLVQVVKEERGTKGAALTTYLSLPGRYCVLMPNTARGGGISRKITNAADRKRLRSVVDELDVPPGMGLIVRTAGAERTRAEIKRDFEFLLRQWEQIRELTLNSIAPTLIYEEGSLIKRSIRDLYSKEIDTILVEGEAGYREAKNYMKMLMPSHARHVQQYTDRIPLFIRYQVESYLSGMFNPVVQMRSGGYIVIGQTEALVAIDVNSGRSTRESSVEETATKTNLEAADEIARQLRLRDLAGLIVIDFIDMDDARNNRAVEKRLKERLKVDRARLQIGRISPFGLLEMSRQRLRPGMVEISTQPCPHCHGQGTIRSDDSLALTILREIEEEGVRGRAAEVVVSAPVSIANFIINAKRLHLSQIEERYGVSVSVNADPQLRSPEYRIEPSKTRTRQPEARDAVVTAESAVAATTVETPEAGAAPTTEDHEKGEGRSRRRRGKRGGRRRRGDDSQQDAQEAPGGSQAAQEGQEREPEAPAAGASGPAEAEAPAAESSQESEATADTGSASEADRRPRKRRSSRGRSGRKEQDTETSEAAAETAEAQPSVAASTTEPESIAPSSPAEEVPEAGVERPEPASTAAAEPEPEAEQAVTQAPAAEAESRQARREDSRETVSEEAPAESPEKPEKKKRSKRRGWWQWR